MYCKQKECNPDSNRNYIDSCDIYLKNQNKKNMFSNPDSSRNYIDSCDNYRMYCKQKECVQ